MYLRIMAMAALLPLIMLCDEEEGRPASEPDTPESDVERFLRLKADQLAYSEFMHGPPQKAMPMRNESLRWWQPSRVIGVWSIHPHVWLSGDGSLYYETSHSLHGPHLRPYRLEQLGQDEAARLISIVESRHRSLESA